MDVTTDTDAIANGASRIDQAAQEFGTQLGTLAGTTNGRPWGTDAPGAAFATAYAELLDHGADALASHRELLDDAVGKLVSWAQSALEVEGRNAVRLERLDGLLED